MDRPVKKRGRPPKNKDNVNNTKKNTKKTSYVYEKELILHLPIDLEDTNIDNESESESEVHNKKDLTISDMSYTDKHNEVSHKETLADKDKQIDSLKKELAMYKKKVEKLLICNEINYDNVKLINTSDGNTTIVEKTDIPCWWCTYSFNTIPCFLPDSYKDNTFHVFGCFCSYDCANAYNFFSINDYKVWERYSLLYKLCNTTNNTHHNIGVADPKEVLQKYGGTKTIVEFRENLNTCKKSYFNLPLIIPLPLTNTVPSPVKITRKEQKNSILNFMNSC